MISAKLRDMILFGRGADSGSALPRRQLIISSVVTLAFMETIGAITVGNLRCKRTNYHRAWDCSIHQTL